MAIFVENTASERTPAHVIAISDPGDRVGERVVSFHFIIRPKGPIFAIFAQNDDNSQFPSPHKLISLQKHTLAIIRS